MDHPRLRATANLLVILAFPPGIEQEEMELQHRLHIHSVILSVLFCFLFNTLLRQQLSTLTHMRNVSYASKITSEFQKYI